jgi:hypothetical protein
MKIAVLGGGHGCYAAAADLSLAGHEVRLWRRDEQALAPLIQAGSIVLKDAEGRREVHIALASADMAQVVRGAHLIVIPSPAVAQHDIATLLAPHLSDGQVVFLPPGTFGSFVMARQVRAAGNRADVLWAETGTLPWLARKHGDREVNVTMRAVRLPTGVYPARRADEALAVIREAFPSVHGCGDALSGALMNAGPIIHPPLVVMNAAPLQHFERWDIHNEGTQTSVRAVTDRLDAERMAMREALGDKSGIRRYGCCYLPMDETLARVVVDLSNRPHLEFRAAPDTPSAPNFPFTLVEEFCRALASNLRANIHVELLYGRDGHHIAEAIFKGLARALREACEKDPRVKGIPSTKEAL